MVDVPQEGRSLLEPVQQGHRMGRRPSQNPVIIECNKLYGFEISDAALERTDWAFPSSASLRIIPVDIENYRKFITTFHDQDGSGYYSQQDRTYLKLLYAPWKKSLLTKGSFEETKLPVEAETRKLAQEQRWITDEYRHLWHNNSGGSAVLTEVEKSGFILQTPNDDEPFCSLSISEFQPTGNKGPSCGGIYVADEEYSLKNLLGSTSIQDYCLTRNNGAISNFHVFSMLLPVRILQKHTAATRKRLVDLAKELTLTEERIARLSEDIALGKMMQSTEKDNRLLNEMNLRHMKYHRRWNFEHELGASILRYFDMVAARDTGFKPGKHKHIVQAKAMRDQVERQIRSSESLKYDFDTIPRRIRNQSKAIFNLMIQRDNQLNLTIAEHSRHLNKINTDIAKSSQQIAVESRRDSASMKTIAVLTLIFLPGTFVASMFSMQLFNWNPDPGQPIVSKYFWIYIAISIPLTMFVLLGWLVFYCFWQKPRTQHVKDIETGLPPLPPKRTDLAFKSE